PAAAEVGQPGRGLGPGDRDPRRVVAEELVSPLQERPRGGGRGGRQGLDQRLALRLHGGHLLEAALAEQLRLDLEEPDQLCVAVRHAATPCCAIESHDSRSSDSSLPTCSTGFGSLCTCAWISWRFEKR